MSRQHTFILIMKPQSILKSVFECTFMAVTALLTAGRIFAGAQPADLVNPLIGTGGHGHTYPVHPQSLYLRG